MNLVAEIMRALAAKGASMDMIMAAVEVVERDVEQRKAKVREGVQKHREKNRQPVMLQVATGGLQVETDPPAPLSPNDISKPLTPLTPPAEADASVRPKRVRTSYGDDFEKFWVGYPTDAIMSKKEAFAEWQKLTPDERIEAIESLTGFNGYCQSHSDYRPVHANRYLKQRRFETVGKAQRAVNQQVFIATDDPLWAEWEAYGLRTRRKGYPTTQRIVDGRSVSGWTFPSAKPPPIEHQRRMEAAE